MLTSGARFAGFCEMFQRAGKVTCRHVEVSQVTVSHLGQVRESHFRGIDLPECSL
jgi:hypothetical protein